MNLKGLPLLGVAYVGVVVLILCLLPGKGPDELRSSLLRKSRSALSAVSIRRHDQHKESTTTGPVKDILLTPREIEGMLSDGRVRELEADAGGETYDCRRSCNNVQGQPPTMCGGKVVHLYWPGTQVCAAQVCASTEQVLSLQKIGFEPGFC